MLNKSYYGVIITCYSSSFLYEKIRENNIKVLSIKRIDDYQYLLDLSFIELNKIKKCFKDYHIIYQKGFLKILFNQFKYKLTIFSFILSCLFFIYLNTLLFNVEVKGQNNYINQEILIYLNQNKIKKYQKKPSKLQLDSVSNEILRINDDIASISYSLNGTNLIFNYVLKETEIKNDINMGKYYASKEGIICRFEVEKGNIIPTLNQYVKKGELLIDDYVYLNEKPLYIGGYGKVFAYTWKLVEVSINTKTNEVDTYINLIDKARNHIHNNLDEDGLIYSESILSFNYTNLISNIKIHYTLIENIAILSIEN